MQEMGNIASWLNLAAYTGMGGVVFVIWYFDQKRSLAQQKSFENKIAMEREAYEKHLAAQKAHYDEVLKKGEAWMVEMRQMYVNNGALVKRHQELIERSDRMAERFADVMEKATDTLAKLSTTVMSNNFCPIVRNISGVGEKACLEVLKQKGTVNEYQ